MSDIEIYIESARYDQHWNNFERPINPDNETIFIQLWYGQHWNNIECPISSDNEWTFIQLWYGQHWNNVECLINSDNESTFIQLWYDQHWNNVGLNQYWCQILKCTLKVLAMIIIEITLNFQSILTMNQPLFNYDILNQRWFIYIYALHYTLKQAYF